MKQEILRVPHLTGRLAVLPVEILDVDVDQSAQVHSANRVSLVFGDAEDYAGVAAAVELDLAVGERGHGHIVLDPRPVGLLAMESGLPVVLLH
mgnify:CR=1 FL=1